MEQDSGSLHCDRTPERCCLHFNSPKGADVGDNQVVAVNDEPVVSGPNEYSDMENTWFSLELLGVNDLDARDRLTRNETVSMHSRHTGPLYSSFTHLTSKLLK